MSNNIKNKVVAITGGSSGIGEATARHLADLGAKIVLGARREDKLQAIVNDIKKNGGEAEYVVMDVTKRSDVEALVQKLIPMANWMRSSITLASCQLHRCPLSKSMSGTG